MASDHVRTHCRATVRVAVRTRTWSFNIRTTAHLAVQVHNFGRSPTKAHGAEAGTLSFSQLGVQESPKRAWAVFRESCAVFNASARQETSDLQTAAHDGSGIRLAMWFAMNWRTTSLVAGAFMLGGMAAGAGSLRAAWEPLARVVGLTQRPVAASASVLSEHEIEALDGMPPQQQAELLLERSINHYRGANEEIAARVTKWRGRITVENRLRELFITAINSDDLTVRVAGIEVDIAGRNIVKDSSTVDRLEPVARWGEQGPRANALWDLALIGNRGVEQERVFNILVSSTDDGNQNIRYWAVEGLAYLATDAAIEPLLNIFHDDPSPMIRERAACGLAQSGMFSATQRMTAVPSLLNFAQDGALQGDTREWVFQALRDITGQNLPHDATRWRDWYAAYSKR
jgi:HEAT repeat protein